MNPKDFLDTADRLTGGTASEADLRSAISRAYYSCYHLLRIEIKSQMSLALLQQSGMGGKLIDHGRLCSLLKSIQITHLLGTNLELLKMARHQADYDLEKNVRSKYATDSVQNAKDFHGDVNTAGGVAIIVGKLHTHLQSIHGNI